MPPAAIIGTAVGLAGKAATGIAAAGAEGRAGVAQQQRAEQERAQAISAAEPSAGELAAAERQLQVSERAIARQEKLLEAIDPSLIEAGKQALALLKGEEAASLSPLRRQRERQRGMLEGRLREQLGEGFETSSAGSEALNRFDEQTSSTLAGAQEQTLGRLLGVSQAVRPSQSELVNIAGAPLQTQMAFQNRQLQARLGTGTAQFAGASDRASAKSLRSIGDVFGGISELGSTALGGLSGLPRGGTSTTVTNSSFSGDLGEFGKSSGVKGPSLFG